MFYNEEEKNNYEDAQQKLGKLFDAATEFDIAFNKLSPGNKQRIWGELQTVLRQSANRQALNSFIQFLKSM